MSALKKQRETNRRREREGGGRERGRGSREKRERSSFLSGIADTKKQGDVLSHKQASLKTFEFDSAAEL